jgi:phage shock protein E
MDFFSSLFGTPVPSLPAKDLQQKLNSQESMLVLDVREPDEFQSGHITGAILIPLGELGRRVNDLPKEKPIICVCQSGSRSLTATRFLLSAGFNAINMSHGMMAWELAGLLVIRGMEGLAK